MYRATRRLARKSINEVLDRLALDPLRKNPHSQAAWSADWSRRFASRKLLYWSVPRNPERVAGSASKSLLLGDFEAARQNRSFPGVPRILLASLPKSGSLFLLQLFSEVFGLFNSPVGSELKQGNIFFPRAFLNSQAPYGTISHSHATPDQVRPLQRLGFQPFVTMRSLGDALVSRRDMLRRDSWVGPVGPDVISAMDDAELLDFVCARFAVPYIEFFSAWRSSKALSTSSILWAEDWFGSPQVAIDAFANAFQLDPLVSTSSALERIGNVNFNQGTLGRSSTLMEERHWDFLAQIAAPYGIRPDDRFLTGI